MRVRIGFGTILVFTICIILNSYFSGVFVGIITFVHGFICCFNGMKRERMENLNQNFKDKEQ
jgi:hypothetical protein